MLGNKEKNLITGGGGEEDDEILPNWEEVRM